ncbi:uncharacterized protein AMSG_11769 [Thecamonas trahens ATCC 50062]|uniref:GS catalytic domain-containing protein n=1 Tax=Thecamonas trahens ATCC 50062 TaxID=461836 RepID=A0A0L0D4U9_THETB|nr:hypothetical protein AMSG_11769 [Thecamonas trahens ATCC 50062]KNC47086.1 hypothetical protein AMSG_11769 [Thecamonas trahens ATCC 50062]|eukprot:XP_013760002.1 hypothetical protein AMSG_11769 [Thecamonas trahens ATCC 50062]
MLSATYLGSTRRAALSAISTGSRWLSSTLASSSASVVDASYGADRFSFSLLSSESQAALAECETNGTPLSAAAADDIAATLHDWAVSRGAVSYSHMFSPLREGPAEKHDSFLAFKSGRVTSAFTGSMLLSGETDGSSFPNGGLRGTHRAGAYTAWDVTSAPWVRSGTLCLPSVFVTHEGTPIDEKTPLLRSMEAISEASLKVLRALGDKDSTKVVPEVGWEQEFFVLDRELVLQRPDVVTSGRTLVGAAPSRGQQTDANYFGAVPPRVKAMLRDVQDELWSLGISCATLHNEVAPAQHETAPIFGVTNVAADENKLMMQVLKDVAAEHELFVLLHEKPFANLNGSGKHNNWSLTTSTGVNLCAPGSASFEQAAFTTFTAAVVHAFAHHGDLLRASVATAGNDHRLGAQEAPPAIMSMYLGENLTAHMDAVLAGGALEGYSEDARRVLGLGTRAVPPLRASVEDRNRTAPMPFIGNRFEFRAVGSNQDISTSLTFLHAAVIDGLEAISKRTDAGDSIRDAVSAVLADSMHVVFNGDAYSDEWAEEAERRGLPNNRDSASALGAIAADKNVDLLSSTGILEREAVFARAEIAMEAYSATIELEATAMLKMLQQGYLPAAATDEATTGGAASTTSFSADKAGIYGDLTAATAKLAADLDSLRGALSGEAPAAATKVAAGVASTMATTRAAADTAELVLPASLYPYPTYEELLFRHHTHSAYERA